MSRAPDAEARDGGRSTLSPRWSNRPSRSELAFWLLPVAAYFVFSDYLVLGSQILIAGLFVVSLDLIVGYAGIVSLGHAAFFGVGAYAAGILAVQGWGEPLTGLAVAGVAAAGVGFASSFLVVGGQGLTRLMVTLGIGMLLHEAANQASSVTGGADGLTGVALWPLLGLWHFDLFGRAAYLYALVVLSACFVVLRRVVKSPFGLALCAIRENERRVPAIGGSVRGHLVRAYTLSAGLAGVAGALSAQTTEFVGLESLGFERSANALIMLVLGGSGRLYGALVGTALFLLLREIFSDLQPAYWQLWVGLLVMVSAFVARGGVVGGAARLLDKGRARRLEARRGGHA